ncbi:FAD-dependent oxidoreductase [Shewanella sp. D64]|uniref:glycerol-3-phosphate dehydrogenase/oxidase n=1 Tax=unclassified Shewanella TaxID=196818 RepID=UPI0022BA350C|nr:MULTISPECIES: FAD-dependent oxidoreductase [unclassified Shewanella]MEC4728702.1 FAD-dependent oxidoreductase [Shewanella sp. D64]MEC4740640.1 FAD-dependent oxidoreductase [Shewanella sp. E94]WBJ94470.1 FAD-dependent oxidoreductase [Shewanella sp. MTB7]
MDTFDLVIIGGGINGAGIAQSASAAGYNVLLLEKGEVGEQTSANSSKLIHGGLRYLESGQVSLVRKSLSERRALLKLAPSLVKPIPFYIPIYESSQRSQWAIRAGLSAYALLSELDPLGRYKSISATKWPEIQGLKLKGLVAIFQYWDAQTDDKALTKAVIKSAIELGTKVLQQTRCDAILHKPAHCEVSYQHQGEHLKVAALCVINATGPWVNELIDCVTPPMAREEVELVQGTHLLLDIAPPEGILYLESCFDQRVVFVMPWRGKTLLGTTETPLASLEGKPKPKREEIYYLLGIYQHYFADSGGIEILESKIIDTFCGVRVLPKQVGTSFERSRELWLQTRESHPRLLTLYGGKLTTFRSTAKEVTLWLEQMLGGRKVVADIDSLPLY